MIQYNNKAIKNNYSVNKIEHYKLSKDVLQGCCIGLYSGVYFQIIECIVKNIIKIVALDHSKFRQV